MTFKDLKQNGIAYILDIKEITLSQAKVLGVGLPHLDTHYSTGTDLVIDIILEVDGCEKTFTMKENCELGYAGNLLITPNRDAVLNEVRSIKLKNEGILDQVTYYKESIDKCSTLLKEFDPIYKEKQENDARMCRLEKSLQEMQDVLKVLAAQAK